MSLEYYLKCNALSRINFEERRRNLYKLSEVRNYVDEDRTFQLLQ